MTTDDLTEAELVLIITGLTLTTGLLLRKPAAQIAILLLAARAVPNGTYDSIQPKLDAAMAKFDPTWNDR